MERASSLRTMDWIVRTLLAIALLLAVSLAPLQSGIAVQGMAPAVISDCEADPCDCDKAMPSCATLASCSAQCAPVPMLSSQKLEQAIPAGLHLMGFEAAELTSRSDVPRRRPPRA